MGKKSIITLPVSLAIICAAVAAILLLTPARPPEWRLRVDEAAARLDPLSMDLASGDRLIAAASPSPHDIQTGLIRLQDGERVKFWFISHHLIRRGKSFTRFDFPDGTRRYFTGCFCCEVEFGPVTEFPSRREFITWLDQHDGISP